jgi:hypothetical protein
MEKKNGFVFSAPGVGAIGEAKDLKEFRRMLREVPTESLEFHARNGDFASWLEYWGRKDLARGVAKAKPGKNLRKQLVAGATTKPKRKKSSKKKTKPKPRRKKKTSKAKKKRKK